MRQAHTRPMAQHRYPVADILLTVLASMIMLPIAIFNIDAVFSVFDALATMVGVR